MSKFNTLPVGVQQLIESFESELTHDYIKANQVVTLENIRDACSTAIFSYQSKQMKKKFK
jgi:hypothetical protein